MTQTVSKIAYGISLSYSATLGGSYTALAELLDITPPEETVENAKVYRSDNTAAVVEKIAGWTDIGDAEATITYQPGARASIAAMRGLFKFWKVVYPLVGSQAASDVDSFYGFISHIGKETPLKDAMKCKIKITISGDNTFTQGS
jgi:hypothetical protein